MKISNTRKVFIRNGNEMTRRAWKEALMADIDIIEKKHKIDIKQAIEGDLDRFGETTVNGQVYTTA